MRSQRVQYSNMGIKHSYIVSDIKTPNFMPIPKTVECNDKIVFFFFSILKTYCTLFLIVHCSHSQAFHPRVVFPLQVTWGKMVPVSRKNPKFKRFDIFICIAWNMRRHARYPLLRSWIYKEKWKYNNICECRYDIGMFTVMVQIPKHRSQHKKKLQQTRTKKPLVPYFNSQSHCHDHKMHMEWLAEALDQRTFSKEAAAKNMSQVPTVPFCPHYPWRWQYCCCFIYIYRDADKQCNLISQAWQRSVN